MKTIIHVVGGAGINIAAKYLEILKEKKQAVGEVYVNYIDTTTKDIKEHKNIPEESIYLIESSKLSDNVDGSGGARAYNDEHIKEFVKGYVDDLDSTDKDINIVIASGSGGTGSMAVVRLTQALKESGKVTLVLLIADTSSLMYCNNTLQTLKHIDLAAKELDCTIPVALADNTAYGIKIVDKYIATVASMLCVLNNDMNKSLDATDVSLFAKNSYDKKTKGMVSLSVVNNDGLEEFKDAYISTMRILAEDDSFELDIKALPNVRQYKIGYLDTGAKKLLEEEQIKSPVYFIICNNSNVEKLEKIKKTFLDRRKVEEKKVDPLEDLDLDMDI